MPDDLFLEGSTTLDAFEDTKRSRVHVCDSSYVCVGDDERGFAWQKEKKGEALGNGVAGCRIDSLAALASGSGCKFPDGAPKRCKVAEPCVYDPSLKDEQVRCVSRRTTGAPDMIPAEWRCVDKKPTPSVHEKVEENNFGSMVTFVLGPKEQVPEPLATPPPPTPQPEPLATPSQPTPQPAPQPTPQPTPPPTTEWTTCKDWFQSSVRPSCSVDRDCPVYGEDAVDVWFDEMIKGAPASKMTMNAFLKHASRKARKVELKWEPDGSNAKLEPKQLREQLQEMHANDHDLRHGIDQMLRQERFLRSAFRDEFEGKLCQQNVCANASSLRPGVLLFDGHGEVEFRRQGNDSVVATRGRGGVAREVQAVSCVGDGAPMECRDPLTRILEPKRKGDANVTLKGASADHFRIKFDDAHDFLVHNKTKTKTGKEDCAQRLCERHPAQECPAPFCSRHGDHCVPNTGPDSKVSSLVLDD